MKIDVHEIVGTASPLLGFSISLTDIADWLKIVSLIVGIAVGVISFLHIREKNKYLRKQHEKDNTDA